MFLLKKEAEKILKYCLVLKRKESLLIITDKNKKKIAKAIFEEGKKLCKKAELVKIPIGKVHGEEPPKDVANLMRYFDVIVAPTTMSITHTTAVRNARKKGKRARIATMPGVTEAILKRCMSADYKRIERVSKKIGLKLKKATKIRIITPKGTDIVIFIDKKARPMIDTGTLHKKGKLSNLPAGEVCLVPKYGKTEGVFVADASIGGIGKLKEPVKIFVKRGYAIKIKGGKEAEKLKKILKKYGKNSYNIAEFGIGTNYKAKITGNVLEDEKAMGTCHIALGNSKGLGGKIYAKCHLDCVIKKPTIYADGKIIIKEGALRIK
ncbi:MAG: aminopeptidase [Candidatus Woesearchaeota archaeon]|nr:aminopeptidase [Candidatus Woesearchaeota archaeon]